jgi:N-methylhydantoinase A
LRVGPQSAGAAPGPACYGRGGVRPTVTDANVVLGFLNPAHLLDGDMPIDIEDARRAITDDIAQPLGLSLEEAAWGIHAVADAAMTRAIQAVSSEIGRAPGDFVMVAFGGNGGVHGATLAAHAGISDIAIPPASGVFSALGLLFARIQHRLVSVYWRDLDKIDYAALNLCAQDLNRQAAELMAAEGVALDQSELRLALDMRYARQSSELSIPAGQDTLTPDVVARAEEQFHREHERSYGYCSRGEQVQLVNLRLQARGLERHNHLPAPSALRASTGKGAAERPVYFGPGQGWLTAPVLRRDALTQAPLKGPVIVEEYDTTIVVPLGATVQALSGIVRIRLGGTD